jgi:hypothetical protein
MLTELLAVEQGCLASARWSAALASPAVVSVCYRVSQRVSLNSGIGVGNDRDLVLSP